jgi:DNA-binding response OmpR family regulator
MPGPIQEPRTTPQTTVKLILVVDDEVDIGMLVVQLIQEEMGHRALHHPSGNQAIEACRTQTPHLFILDYGLPDMTGLQLHDQLHAFDHLSAIPTLLVSARKPPPKEMRRREISFLAKPFDMTRLQQTIVKLLA